MLLSFHCALLLISKNLLITFFLLCITMVLGLCFDLAYCDLSFCCALLWWSHLPMVLFCFVSALWCFYHDLLLCIAFIFSIAQHFDLSCSSIAEAKHLPIMLLYCAWPWFWVDLSWSSLLQCPFVVHHCDGLMSCLPLMSVCFVSAEWCSYHYLLLCIVFVFYYCLEF
jgi:hypothetical protein